MKPTWESKCGRASLYLADALDVLPDLAEPATAVLTDPPYSSGGAFRGDRASGTIKKYVQTGMKLARHEFSGDNRDQRGFLVWASMLFNACRQASAPGAALATFTDWRQLPTMTDAVQAGGWVWRNLGTWWKPGIRMQKGRFSSSAEYIIYATNGPHSAAGEKSPQNVFSAAPVPTATKSHIAKKPPAVARWLLGLAAPNGLILDPCMGSGTFLAEAIAAGHRAIGVDCDQRSFDEAKRLIEAALKG